MFNLSVRERKLLIILAGLLAFFVWYKTFFGFLLPNYRQVNQLEEQTISLERELSDLLAEITAKESQLEQLKSEISSMKDQFSSHVGFLLYDIGKMAMDKVNILGVDTQDISNDGYFYIQSISIRLEGPFQAVVDFVRELENMPSLSLKRIELKGATEQDSGIIEASLLVHLYDFLGKEIFPSETSFRYEPYQNPNPFETSRPARKENTNEFPQNTELVEDHLYQETNLTNSWPLAPYTFPVK